jgi:hypothetical protein
MSFISPWISGFGIGLLVGVTVMNAAAQTLRRRQIEALERLLAAGDYQLQKNGGAAVEATELFAAINIALGMTISGPRKKRLLWVVIASALAAGSLTYLVASRLNGH